LGSLLATVPVEEAKIFQHDLKALKLI